ncbi:UDP-N-acetylmuramoyl-L-alanyl-D-glutamate--2,6-diaminopimelate ligase [Microbulbifer sp. 2304DJ12-6]|uniref:UDP-N-acetylmuramoyl-L-alanyl-D-glutamate--2, 6-diaminopimelate ligase n=1 Tax=Microbulbifer sp. 2304DJ12-6 TaxID=3233340 RepID=UPI0039AFE9E2
MIQRKQQGISLRELVPGYAGIPDVPVTGVALDSRRVKTGDVFMALRGSVVDGREYIDAAIAAGAAAILADSDKLECINRGDIQVVSVPGLAKRVGEIAARFHGNPSGHMHLVGVTGTNGKTTCAYLISQLLAHHFGSAALIGTIGNGIWYNRTIELQETGLTTPDPVRLQADFADYRERGVPAAAMEVSSHSLSQGRVHGLVFDTAIFTNLSRDHLDYHGNMAAYGMAKEKLFGLPQLKRGIINLDDPFGAQLAERCKVRGLQVLTYGLQAGDLHVTDLCRHEKGFSVELKAPWGRGELQAPLIGDFNIYNALAVVAAVASAGMPFEAILAAFPSIQAVPGRMQRVRVAGADDVGVLVDYAHTPDALRAALAAARPYCRGNLWCVFGCGGERDRGKRAAMGRIASEMADRAIVTSDNPRSEKPQKIIDDILQGAASTIEVEIDRAEAIARTVASARPGDIVIIAGKGHENYQIVGGAKNHFCDHEHVAAALRRRLGAGAGSGMEGEVW